LAARDRARLAVAQSRRTFRSRPSLPREQWIKVPAQPPEQGHQRVGPARCARLVPLPARPGAGSPQDFHPWQPQGGSSPRSSLAGPAQMRLTISFVRGNRRLERAAPSVEIPCPCPASPAPSPAGWRRRLERI
jgi:hypothetical protein